jgi:hypothetical protein
MEDMINTFRLLQQSFIKIKSVITQEENFRYELENIFTEVESLFTVIN